MVPPTHVGPYRLCAELGSGGMATVHLGHRESGGTERFAAVKVLHPHLANDIDFTEMFFDEAEIAARIRHVNVCSVYDYDVSSGRSYIAMEYLVGHTLASIHRKLSGTTPDFRAVRLALKALADACHGLHAAHELTDDDGEPLDVVHRDVSPGNLMLTFDGVAKVLDFGVAAASGKRHLTQTGMVKGKLAYIAPECLRGKKADRRADVWAIGVVAWELVTGKRLFHRPTDVDTLRAVMAATIPRPSSIRHDLPAEIDEIVMRAISRDREARHGTARELGRDLARVANAGEDLTSADLAEWLDRLFPGSRAHKLALLENAERALVSGAAPRRDTEDTRASSLPPPPTAVLDSTPTQLIDSPFPRDERPARAPVASWAVAAALAVGLLGGALGVELTRHASAEAPPTAVAVTPVADRTPEVRLVPGAGAQRGPYVLELVESGPDALVLRVRLDPDANESASRSCTPTATELPAEVLAQGP
jgi:serine/threonine-protein kinase